MKKSRIAKLALMGASITALAATLTTSTYAWYVSNKTAKVNESTGSSAEAGADGSITVSATGDYGTFFNEITLGSFTTAKLLPVVTSDGKTFMSLKESDSNGDGVNDIAKPENPETAVAAGNDGAGKVFKYVFYIMSDGDVTNVKPNIIITNKTAETAYVSQINYSKNTIGGILKGQPFYVNALNAMSFSFWSTASSTEVDASHTTGTYGDATLAGFQKLSAKSNGTYIKTATDNDCPGTEISGGAVSYYEEASGLTLTDNDSYKAKVPFSSKTAFSTISLQAGKPVKLEYYLWIDGAADLCFNACEQQNFSVKFTYTV